VRPSRIRVVEHRAVTVGEQQAIVEEERRVSGQELVLDLVGADALPAHAVNEGSLLVIGLLTVLVSPQRSGMLLLDDVDESLHPAAQEALIREVCNLLASDGELQVVMTGRSPALTEALKARDVWLLEADAGGNAVARCLTDPVDSDAAP
jgi:predicted ATPase